ncbi:MULTISPECIES: primosomal protein N' [Luteimonas]|uniref:primosomal protein N' n=1 Tax=Luteimonas TaxID=83614 RepID=UPI000C7C245A|nr:MULTISPECIES: primosomal protein N' [Luteimonas]
MSIPDRILRVALPVPLPRLFDYRAPTAGDVPSAADVGRRVRVPFGPRELVGVVAAVEPPGVALQGPDAPALRAALAWLDDAALLRGELADSLRWLARYTHAPLGEVLATALPASLRRGDALPETHAWAWRLTEAGSTALPGLKAGGRPRRFAELLQAAPRDEEALDPLLAGWRSAARTLAARALVERIAIPASQLVPVPQAGPALHDEQRAAADAVRACSGFAALLLDGVTGSGKTEVYLQAIADCLARGRQALVLVPEIGLTPQTLARFRARLGVPVHALHSGLNDAERARVWAAALRGEARVVVGTRSAIFVPLPDAGLIVIDEEHDGSYKQQDGIRYHARDFALVRGKALDVPVLLGSATPSLESLQNAVAGRYRHLRLSHRAGAARPPVVRVLDVRKRPLEAGLSPDLLTAIAGALAAGGQVLVFKNRRGYAPVLLCHDCGWSAHCPRCSTPEHARPMTVHASGRRLQCHHCGHRASAPLSCPDCASLGLQPQGVGTERIEELLAARFTDVPVLRIDRGSTRGKDALAKIFDDLGTRPGILMVAVVGIDEGLFSADFRASEKLAQLLIQVAGRAGRADKAGLVLLQTHHPEHPLLQTLIQGGYHAFAGEELQQREAAGFPPFAPLALLRAESTHAEPPMTFLHAVRQALAPHIRARTGDPAQPAVWIDGPVAAPMPRRAGLYRAQLLLTAAQRRDLHGVLDAALVDIHALPTARKTRWSLDVDPVDLY